MKSKKDINPWILRKLVLPQHCDHAGVMWHGTYLNLLEEARIQALSSSGITYKQITENGYEMPVVALEISYLNPLMLGEEIIIKSICMKRIKVSWLFKSSIENNDGLVFAKSKVQLVLAKRIDSGFRLIRRVPEEINISMLTLNNGPKI